MSGKDASDFEHWFAARFPFGIFPNAVMGNMAVAEVGFKDAFREAYVAGYNTKACEARDAD